MHFVFARMELAEEQGLGLASLSDHAEKLGLPQPRFVWNEPYLVLKLFLSKESAIRVLDKDIIAVLSKSEQEGWQWLATRGHTKSSEYADAINVEPRTARRHLGHFEELGLVRKAGSGPALRYDVT